MNSVLEALQSNSQAANLFDGPDILEAVEDGNRLIFQRNDSIPITSSQTGADQRLLDDYAIGKPGVIGIKLCDALQAAESTSMTHITSLEWEEVRKTHFKQPARQEPLNAAQSCHINMGVTFKAVNTDLAPVPSK